MTTILTAHHASDFLALVPSLAGFRPRDSIVLVAFRGNRTCGALRVDLPDEKAPAPVRKAFTTTMLGMVCKIPDVDAVVPVVYTDDTFEQYAGPPRRALIANLTTRARHGGFLVRDALCVAGDAWGSYLDDGPRLGRPLGLIAEAEHRQSRLLPDDYPGLADRAVESTLEPAGPGERELGTQKYRALDALRGNSELLPALYWEYRFDGDVVAFADDLLTGSAQRSDPFSPAVTGSSVNGSSDDRAASTVLLAFLVQSPALRDTVLMTWCWGASAGDESELTQRMFDDGEDISGMPGAGALGGWDMPRPDPARIRAGIALLKFTAARLPDSARPPVLTMIAWLYWALGAGSIAGAWVNEALRFDPEYGLADLLGTMLGSGHLPEWAFDVPREATDATPN